MLTTCISVIHVNLNRDALIAIRERSGLSKTGLAERAGIDRTLVHRLENGERNATPSVLNKLATALDVPLMALIGPNDEVAA